MRVLCKDLGQLHKLTDLNSTVIVLVKLQDNLSNIVSIPDLVPVQV